MPNNYWIDEQGNYHYNNTQLPSNYQDNPFPTGQFSPGPTDFSPQAPTGSTVIPATPPPSSGWNDTLEKYYVNAAADATSPQKINNLWNIVQDNIRRAQAASGGTAASTAGAYSAQSGSLNPLQTVLAARSQAGAPYVGQLGQAEQGRAGMLQQAGMDYFQMLHLIERARAGDQQAAQELALRQQQLDLQRQSLEHQISNDAAGFWDYAGPIIQTAGTVAAAALSDRRLKTNIKRVGKSPSGTNIYEFSYKGGSQRYRGVMADEVPEAALTINGIQYVDYSKTDVPFEVI